MEITNEDLRELLQFSRTDGDFSSDYDYNLKSRFNDYELYCTIENGRIYNLQYTVFLNLEYDCIDIELTEEQQNDVENFIQDWWDEMINDLPDWKVKEIVKNFNFDI